MTRLLIVASLLVVPSAAVAQAPAQPVPWANKLFLKDIEKNPAQPAPAAITHDFGTVPHGTLCAHKFTVTNIYDVPLQVIDVRRSCGCLEAYPPQKVLQPNESAEFTVTMNTGMFNGTNTKAVYVTFGPSYLSQAEIRITATSRAEVQLSPGQVNFGTIPVGAKPTQVLTLEYTGKQRDWKVTGVVPPSGPFTVDVKEAPKGLLNGSMSLLGGGGTKYLVTITLKDDAVPSPLSEVVSLKTNDPVASLVQVNVSGTVEAPLTLSTNVVRFEKVKVGETVSHKVMVRAAAGPFKIKPVTDDGDGLTVDTFPAPAPVQIVTIKFTPDKAGLLRKDVRLKADLGGGATAVITVEGEAVE